MGEDAAAPEAPAGRSRAGSSLGEEDEALGRGLPADWTLEAFQKRVRSILDDYLGSGEANEAVRCFKEFSTETLGFFDEVVVCALRTALERSEQQRSMVTQLLIKLHQEEVLDMPSLARGFAKLVCTWEELVVDNGSQAPVYLTTMLLECIRSSCVSGQFLTRLPEGLLQEVLLNGAKEQRELEEAKDRLQKFKRSIEAAKLLEPPLPTLQKAAGALEAQGMPECHHEFVKRALAASLDWPAGPRRRCLTLIGQLLEKGTLSREDLQWGVIRLLGQLEDLTLDCPDVSRIAAEHIRTLVDKDLLTRSFVLRCRMLRIGGAAGLGVLEDALQPATEAAAAGKGETKAAESDEPKVACEEDAKEAAVVSGGSSSSSKPPGGRLSGAGISLRPGGGLSLRPGGGAGSLTGLGASLRPGGGLSSGAATKDSKKPASSAAGGYPSSSSSHSEAVKKQGGPGAAKVAEEATSWRQAASEQWSSKKGSEKGRCEKLTVSENSWQGLQQRRRQEAEAEAAGGKAVADVSDEEIARRMKSILNKLTLEKFDDLYRQLTDCGISNEGHIRVLMTEVFEKATTQHHFVEMYTSLCVHLSEWFSKHVKVGKFKTVLLDQCQASFEANLRDPPKELSAKRSSKATPEELEELEEKRQRYRHRVMGNIRFIGQLLVKRMVASKVLMACAQELLVEPMPSTLEALASLLTITGKEFDVPSWSNHAGLCDVFSKVEEFSKDKSLPSRTRFLLQDVLDLRATAWEDKKLATKKLEGPRRMQDFKDA